MNRIITAAMAATILAAPAMADAPGYFKIPGTDTTMKIYGNVTLDTAFDTKGNAAVVGPDQGLGTAKAESDDLYPKNQWAMSVNTLTRFGFQTTTPSGSLGDITTKLEGDFYGGKFRIRHAYGTIGNWTIGQTWSTYIDGDGSPDYLDFDGLLADWYGSGRLPQVRYTFNLSKQASMMFALEQDKTGATYNDKGFGKSLVGAFSYAADWGHVYGALAYQKYAYETNVDTGILNPITNTDYFTKASGSKNTLSATLSGSLNIGKDSIVAHIAKGNGYYGAGLQDGVVDTSAIALAQYAEVSGGATPPAILALAPVNLDVIQAFQWDLGYEHVWNDTVKSNVFVSKVTYSSDDTLGMRGNAFRSYLQYGVNTMVALGKAQFGAEYIWGKAKTFADNTITNPDTTQTNYVTESKLRLQMKFNFF